jgi:hypothetical protein
MTAESGDHYINGIQTFVALLNFKLNSLIIFKKSNAWAFRVERLAATLAIAKKLILSITILLLLQRCRRKWGKYQSVMSWEIKND